MKQPRKAAGGIVTGEVTERPRGTSPRKPKDGKGTRLGPSRVPRREEATDEAIGKGEEMLRPRKAGNGEKDR
jgi:hypothetical protein